MAELPKMPTSFFKRRNTPSHHTEEDMQPVMRNANLKNSSLSSAAAPSFRPSGSAAAPSFRPSGQAHLPNKTQKMSGMSSPGFWTNNQPLFSVETGTANAAAAVSNNTNQNSSSISSGNSSSLTSTSFNRPQYRTHGLGHKLQRRGGGFIHPTQNTNMAQRKNRANRSYNNSYKGGMSSEDKQILDQQNEQFLKEQEQFNNQQFNTRGGPGGKRGRGGKRGGRGGGGGHQTVVFHPRNLIKDSFFEDPWAETEGKTATAEEIRRSTDSRGSKRLFNAANGF